MDDKSLVVNDNGLEDENGFVDAMRGAIIHAVASSGCLADVALHVFLRHEVLTNAFAIRKWQTSAIMTAAPILIVSM
jgi:hypothetical protein